MKSPGASIRHDLQALAIVFVTLAGLGITGCTSRVAPPGVAGHVNVPVHDPAYVAHDPDIQAFPVADRTYLFFDEPSIAWQGFSEPFFDFSFPPNDEIHGFQVAYIGTDGTTALWYPGVAQIVEGRWRLTADGSKFCRRYSELDRTTATNIIDDEYWRCHRLSRFREGLIAVAVLPGNPFGLAGGAPAPYLRGKCEAPPEFDLAAFPAGRFGNCRF